jgi:signal transduction histidine kinase
LGLVLGARLRLTVWYGGFILALLLVLGAIVFVLMSDRLDRQIDSALGDEALTFAPRLGELRDGGAAEPTVVLDIPTRQRSNEAEQNSVNDLAEQGRFPTQQLLIDDNGLVQESTLSVATKPAADGIEAASSQGSDLRTVEIRDARVRVYTVQVTLDDEPIGFVQAFRSLEDRDDTLSDLRTVFLVTGAFAAVIAIGIGFWLSGRALAPIRRNLQAQERFVADASHELRTPLTVVQASAELLLRHPDRSIGAESAMLEDIVEEAGRMTTLVRDLLDLSTIDQLPLPVGDSDLSAVAADAVRTMRSAAERGDIELQYAPADALSVRGDPAALGQVVRALVDNAIKYGGAGTRVSVSTRRDDGYAVLIIADDGPGIAREDQVRIFERFARVDKARSRALGGSGLGLAIARAIVERHRGTISVESTMGAGATFTVRLPVA